MKKFWKKTEGFTLVELIVVIAILGILAGVGTVGYSGYVKKANMAADQQLVAGVRNALELQYYSDGFEGVSAVVLTTDGAASAKDTDSALDTGFVEKAMTAAYGGNWRDALSLSYGKWGNGAAVASNVLQHFAEVAADPDNALSDIYSGNIAPSFADEVDDLFVLVKDVAVAVGGMVDTSGAALVQGAADKTVEVYDDAADFASVWAVPGAWNTMVGSDYAIANAAVLKARNTALACYLIEQEGVPASVYDVIANYTTSGEGSIIPADVVGAFIDTESDEYDDLLDSIAECYGETDSSSFFTALGAYFSDGAEGSNSIAYNDALAYYAMMDTVNNVNSDNSDDETYWDDMASAVSLYGSIASGTAGNNGLNALLGTYSDMAENTVVITFMVANGTQQLVVSPSTAMSRNE